MPRERSRRELRHATDPSEETALGEGAAPTAEGGPALLEGRSRGELLADRPDAHAAEAQEREGDRGSVKRRWREISHGTTSITQPHAQRYRQRDTEITTDLAPALSTPHTWRSRAS